MISVSIVTYNTDLKELGNALSCLDTWIVDNIDIVDNGNQYNQLLRFQTDKVHILQSGGNIGYGAGHNISINRSIASGAKYHLVMNSDISFSPSDLELMVARMEADDGIAAMHPRIVNSDGDDLYTARMLPTPFDLLLRRFLPKWFMPQSRKRYLLLHLDHNKEFEIPYMQGSFMLMRVDAIKKIGMFDQRFFMYPEDIDLSRRLLHAGRVLYFPQAKVAHLHRAESYKSPKMLKVHIVNMIRYFNKWGWLCDKERKEVNALLRKGERLSTSQTSF